MQKEYQPELALVTSLWPKWKNEPFSVSNLYSGPVIFPWIKVQMPHSMLIAARATSLYFVTSCKEASLQPVGSSSSWVRSRKPISKRIYSSVIWIQCLKLLEIWYEQLILIITYLVQKTSMTFWDGVKFLFLWIDLISLNFLSQFIFVTFFRFLLFAAFLIKNLSKL